MLCVLPSKLELQNVVADGGHSITIDGKLVSMIGMNRDMCIQYLEYLESKHIPWAVTDRNKLGRITPYKEILEWHPDWDVFKTVVGSRVRLSQCRRFL